MPYVKVNDITMYYEIHGEGEPLVLIPGWGGEISSIAGLIADFARDYQVIAIDNRGTGRTDKPDSPWSIETMADDIAGVLDTLGIQRTHIVGISMGSMIAMMIAAKYPDRVNGLVLHVGFTRITFLVKTIMNLIPYLPGGKKKMDAGMAAILGQKYPPTPASFRRQGEAVVAFDGRKYLGRIRAPTIVINATRDQFVPQTISRELAGGIAGARLILLDGDHTISRTNPELFVGLAHEFLAHVDNRN